MLLAQALPTVISEWLRSQLLLSASCSESVSAEASLLGQFPGGLKLVPWELVSTGKADSPRVGVQPQAPFCQNCLRCSLVWRARQAVPRGPQHGVAGKAQCACACALCVKASPVRPHVAYL